MTAAMTGRKDWDFVAMDDYQSDMRESADQAVAVIEYVKGREKDALNRVAFLELALADALKQLGPGASASVHDHLFRKLPSPDSPGLRFERCEYDATWRVSQA